MKLNDYHSALLRRHFLGVARVRHRLVLVVLEPDVAQGGVGHVLHVDPLDGELAAPLVLRPDAQRRRHVHRRRLNVKKSKQKPALISLSQVFNACVYFGHESVPEIVIILK